MSRKRKESRSKVMEGKEYEDQEKEWRRPRREEQ